MTPEMPPPPSSGDEIDFSALVAEHNQSNAARASQGRSKQEGPSGQEPVSYTHLRAHETVLDLVCRLLLEKKK